MSSLAQAFSNLESRVTKVIFAIDLTCSTAMKEQQPEVQWLPTYGWFFDLVAQTVKACQGTIVKYLGDGAMVVFADDQADAAINCAIQIQEAIAAAKAIKRYFCDCSIGIACGEIVEFVTPDGAKDYIGSFADKAFRLCAAANGKAIFVDTDTVSNAQMSKVRSNAGVLPPGRKPAEYRGPEQSIKAKGFSQPVMYHEILWDQTRYGVSSPFVTNMSSQQTSAQLPPCAQPYPRAASYSTPPPRAARLQWLKGRVTTLHDRFGFVLANGEEFWFNPDYLFCGSQSPRSGEEVWFWAAEPFAGRPNRRAMDVVPFNAVLCGTIEQVMLEGYGFAVARTDRGDSRQIFLNLGAGKGWEKGVEVEFDIGENKKGMAGYNPRRKAESGLPVVVTPAPQMPPSDHLLVNQS